MDAEVQALGKSSTASCPWRFLVLLSILLIALCNRQHFLPIILKPARHNKNSSDHSVLYIVSLLLTLLLFVFIAERHAQITSLSTGLYNFLVHTVGSNATI